MSYFLLLRNGRPWINGRPSENVVDEKKKKKKLNGCTFSAVFKNKSRGILITRRHCISNVTALQILGWKWRFGSFIRNYNISTYQEKENYAVIKHSYFSEFNHNPWTLSHACHSRWQHCVTTKLRQSLKVTTFISAFLCSFRSMTTMYQRKTTESATQFIYVAIVFVLELRLQWDNQLPKYLRHCTVAYQWSFACDSPSTPY